MAKKISVKGENILPMLDITSEVLPKNVELEHLGKTSDMSGCLTLLFGQTLQTTW